MTEKITRAQAEAALDALEWVAAGSERSESWTLRAYLAQQPSDDVVRKAHEAWRNIDRRFHERDAECMEEPCVLHGWLDELLAALPTMPEEK